MSVAAVVILIVAVFVYAELAIFAGAFMYLKATRNTTEAEDKRRYAYTA